ncbi:Histone acetyltransferase ESA1, partial [Dictyocoela roeselum]
RLEPSGYHLVGYFSKEKVSAQGYNVACLLTLPSEQRKGYGKILIEFSYLLSRKEKQIASPEKPLSDLGLLSYLSYWKDAIYSFLKTEHSISEISAGTGITEEDLINAMIYYKIIKFVKGIPVFVRGKGKLRLDENKLVWDGYKYSEGAVKML